MLCPLKITTPPRLFRSGNGAAFFCPLQSQWYRFTANLFFHSIQSNHKSALLFSCTCPFSGACRYYTTFFLKSQTYVHIFLRKKLKNFSELCTIPKGKGRNIEQKQAAALQRKPSRRDEKGDPQAGQRGRLFAAGISIAACFSCASRLETAI